jgi:hypothetical protein
MAEITTDANTLGRHKRIQGSQNLTLLGCHDVNATRHLGHLFAVTFRAPYLRCLVLSNGFGALE